MGSPSLLLGPIPSDVGYNGLTVDVANQRQAMLNSKYFPRDEYFRHHSWEQEDNNERVPVNEMKQRPHLQVRGLCYHYRRSPSDSLHLLDNISIEARPGDILGILATTRNELTHCQLISISCSWLQARERHPPVEGSLSLFLSLPPPPFPPRVRLPFQSGSHLFIIHGFLFFFGFFGFFFLLSFSLFV